jgi:3-dehydroquinate synthase
MRIPPITPDTERFSPDRIFLVSDSNLPAERLEAFKATLAERFHGVPMDEASLEGGEGIKTTQTLSALWSIWSDKGLSRSSCVIAAGGGTLTDVVGFAASTFKRGVNWIVVPTTLLCMVDAAIGGKTGINASGIKNLVGSFWPPVAVWTEATWLHSLPQKELWNGWMEMAKHALVGDAGIWGQTATSSPLLATTDELFDWAMRSAAIKQAIVEDDPIETGKRKVLNFGHTLGHALEACSQEAENASRPPMPHGIAVGWGMRWALRWSADLTPDAAAELLTAEKALAGWLEQAAWGKRPAFAPEALWQKMLGDKKNHSGAVLDIALAGLGKPNWDQPLSRDAFELVWQQLA